ncbi:MAG: glycosyltransferase [Polyangiaceae bacterium]
MSEFEERERARRDRRVSEFDRAADWRATHHQFRAYYGKQMQRLLEGLSRPRGAILEVGVGLGDLLASLGGSSHYNRKVGIDVAPRMIELARERHPELELHVADVEIDDLAARLGPGKFDTILITDTVGLFDDVQRALERLAPLLAEGGRLVVTYYSYTWEPLLRAGEKLGLKTPWPDQNWLSMTDIENLLGLADYEVVRRGTDVLAPLGAPLVSDALNLVGAKIPIVKEASLVSYFVARHVPSHMPATLPSVSVICPCRNERGNIREAISRTPLMGPRTELIFVDGNSTDGTVEEIEAAIKDYTGPLELSLVPQGAGKGKGDAVRKGFAAAKCDVLMILDSDLTVVPEDLPKFYRALVTGKGEFINGVRLVYPMEGEAMRFLNHVGNKFFSNALSWLLEQPIKDSLCGTKVLTKQSYELIAQNRDFFGDFDPFGDFDLLFGAARLNMKIVDLPVRYRARTYGDTKISRFAHGWLLLKMTAFGFRKLRLGR